MKFLFTFVESTCYCREPIQIKIKFPMNFIVDLPSEILLKLVLLLQIKYVDEYIWILCSAFMLWTECEPGLWLQVVKETFVNKEPNLYLVVDCSCIHLRNLNTTLMVAFWVVTPYVLADGCQRFGGTYCLHLQGFIQKTTMVSSPPWEPQISCRGLFNLSTKIAVPDHRSSFLCSDLSQDSHLESNMSFFSIEVKFAEHWQQLRFFVLKCV
jgi:hypothetical protein